MEKEHFSPGSEEGAFSPEEDVSIKKMVARGVEIEKAKEQTIARRHWKNGHLGVTAEDHLVLGGTPDQELIENPGRTLGEVLPMEEILKELESLKNLLENARKEYGTKGLSYEDLSWCRDNIIHAKKELVASINYLKSIGKLPEEFETFEVSDLVGDPKI